MANSLKTYGWRGRLTQYLLETSGREFRRGWDCAMFVAGAVEAMTGRDLALVKDYPTLAAGYRALHKAGFADHIGYVASLFDEVPVAYAQPGDIAVIPGEDGDALALVQGELIYAVGRDGRYTVPLLAATRAFRV